MCEQIHLYLFSKDELSLSDLALIEDPIHEYLDYQQFQIEQCQPQYSLHDICYALLFDKLKLFSD